MLEHTRFDSSEWVFHTPDHWPFPNTKKIIKKNTKIISVDKIKILALPQDIILQRKFRYIT
jgi:hypothetical protein